MSTGVSGFDKANSGPTLLQNTTNCSAGNCVYFKPYDLQNSLSLAIASSYQPNKFQSFSFGEVCYEGSVLAAYIPLSISCLEYINDSSTRTCVPMLTPEMLYSLTGDLTQSGTKINYFNCYSSGFNVTRLNGTFTKTSSIADSILLLAAGLAIVAASGALELLSVGTATPAVIAAETALNGLSFADTIASALSQCMPKSTFNYNGRYVPSDTSSGCIRTPSVNGAVALNQCPGNGNYYDTYFNAFSSQLLLRVCIPETDFGHSGALQLTGLNLASQDCSAETQCSFPSSSAEVNLSIPICTAHMIEDQVTYNGKALANQDVLITQ